MIQHVRVVPESLVPVRSEGLSLSAVRARVRAFRSEIEEGSEEFEAALVLLTALELGQNTFRLANFTRLDARFVARCARHLTDNRIWQEGSTWCSWLDSAHGIETFWADVQVALGHACRQTDEEGHLRWAPAGQWWKRFEDVEVQLEGSGVDYRIPELPAPGVAGQEPAEASLGEGDEEERERPRIRAGIEFGAIVPSRERREIEGWPEEEAVGIAARPWRDAVASQAFPDAVWLA